mgnify:FL=1
MDKNVEKQLIVRTFEPDMAVLKQVAKQMSGMQDVAPALYAAAYARYQDEGTALEKQLDEEKEG